MNLDTWIDRMQSVSLGRVQMSVGIVFDTTDFLMHQRREERVDEVEDRSCTAKVLLKRDNSATRRISLPGTLVILEDRRISEPEAVNALLDVADHKAIGLGAVAGQRAENG